MNAHIIKTLYESTGISGFHPDAFAEGLSEDLAEYSSIIADSPALTHEVSAANDRQVTVIDQFMSGYMAGILAQAFGGEDPESNAREDLMTFGMDSIAEANLGWVGAAAPAACKRFGKDTSLVGMASYVTSTAWMRSSDAARAMPRHWWEAYLTGAVCGIAYARDNGIVGSTKNILMNMAQMPEGTMSSELRPTPVVPILDEPKTTLMRKAAAAHRRESQKQMETASYKHEFGAGEIDGEPTADEVLSQMYAIADKETDRQGIENTDLGRHALYLAMHKNIIRLRHMLVEGGSNVTVPDLFEMMSSDMTAYDDEIVACQNGNAPDQRLIAYADHWLYGFVSKAMDDDYSEDVINVVRDQLAQLRILGSDVDAPEDVLTTTEARGQERGYGAKCVADTKTHVMIDFMIGLMHGEVSRLTQDKANGYADGYWMASRHGITASREAKLRDTADSESML